MLYFNCLKKLVIVIIINLVIVWSGSIGLFFWFSFDVIVNIVIFLLWLYISYRLGSGVFYLVGSVGLRIYILGTLL